MENEIFVKKENGNEMRRIKKFIKLESVSEMDFYIPRYTEHNKFIHKNYRTLFLKRICKHYKLKISGNKPILVDRIYRYLLSSNSATIIQKYTKRFLRETYNRLLGPAIFKRALCNNDSDFFTMEEIKDIPYREFISIKMENNIWGFNIVSLYNLYVKNNNEVLNPYTREKMGNEIFENIIRILKFGKMFNDPVNILLNTNDYLTSKKKLELYCLELFQFVDKLGNYTKGEWFLTLSKIQVIKFIRELIDIWEYRAQLTDKVKREICYPNGSPFIEFINLRSPHSMNFHFIQHLALSIIEQFIKTGVNKDSNAMGASYVLCALTLVSPDAAEALPWLFQSVSALE